MDEVVQLLKEMRAALQGPTPSLSPYEVTFAPRKQSQRKGVSSGRPAAGAGAGSTTGQQQELGGEQSGGLTQQLDGTASHQQQQQQRSQVAHANGGEVSFDAGSFYLEHSVSTVSDGPVSSCSWGAPFLFTRR